MLSPTPVVSPCKMMACAGLAPISRPYGLDGFALTITSLLAVSVPCTVALPVADSVAVVTLVAVSVAAVGVPVSVGEALGAKMVVTLVLLIAALTRVAVRSPEQV